jgi:beta-glucosidase
MSLSQHTFSFARKILIYGLIACTPIVWAQTASVSAPYRNPSLSIPQRVNDLVSRMTLEEKVSQMQNGAAAIPRLGVPSYDWWSEALHGVAFSGYATVFPQAIGMAATWDAPLIHEEGNVIATEGRGKFNSAQKENNHAIFFGLDFWSPNVNIFRDPRWGRGQETYGEDPFLTGSLAVQFVRGLQGNGPNRPIVIATPKHFDVHSGPEPLRHKFNVNVSPHDLRDTYLPAFRAAIVDAKADSIMCAYNAVDGVPACANKMLLEKILRGDWKFQGYVVSDCGAIGNIADGHKYTKNVEQASVAAVRAGTDLSCGTEYASLVKAVHDGLIQESEIDAAVKRLMTARFELGLFDPPAQQRYGSLTRSIVESPLHKQLDLRAAEESMVLLKNDGTLPLQPAIRTIAVIGPNADSEASLEGNYNGTPIDPQTPLAAFQKMAAKKHWHILDVQGSPYVEQLSLPIPSSAFHVSNRGAEGLSVEYFDNAEFSDAAVKGTAANIEADWNAAAPVPQVSRDAFSVRWTGTFTPPAAGDYQFQVRLGDCFPCSAVQKYTVWMDGKVLLTGTARNQNGLSPYVSAYFADVKPHRFRMEYSYQGKIFGAGISLNWKAPVAALRTQAVELARQADAVIAVVGISPHLEGEEMKIDVPGFDGGDRTSIALPPAQKQLLEALAATHKPLIVVLMNGSALAVDWAQQHANAILEAWYPGARGGEAIVNTLTGKNNPAGRLPVTFYASTAQLPPFEDYSMANRTYRYFTGKPLYGFGYGLSYSTFRFSNLKLSSNQIQAGEPLNATVEITNTSKRAGDEVAELYLEYPQVDRGAAGAPQRALAGFTRVHLGAGATRNVNISLDARNFSHVNSKGERTITPGTYRIFIGGSQPQDSQGVALPVVIRGEKTLAN